MSFSSQAASSIKAEIRMISGCKDDQTSADVGNVRRFNLPDPAGSAGGACTSALLNVLYADKKKPDDDLSFKDVLMKTRDVLSQKGFRQIPQLTSSRPLDLDTKFDLTPEGFKGKKHAVLVGINYVGAPSGVLSGCQNDVLNMVEYLKDVHGFKDNEMNILLDDGKHTSPTRKNMIVAYRTVAAQAQPGDVVYLHYSGHGVSIPDQNGDEADKKDEALVPVDYRDVGVIRDDKLVKILVKKLAAGVFVTSLMDCCHSGTVLDLPFKFRADGSDNGMRELDGFDFGKIDNAEDDGNDDDE